MRGITSWNQTPFTRLTETEKKNQPYICAVAPFHGGFRFEWFDRGSDGEHKVVIHKYETYDDFIEYPIMDSMCVIDGLDKDAEYEFAVWRSDMSASSAKRLVRTGKSFGTTINYLHPQDNAYRFSGRYLGSPCIVRLPSGKLIAQMDVHDGDDAENLAILFDSTDGGKTWHYLTELSPCFWGKLFYHRGRLYNIACAAVYGDIIIGCSEDEGKTWSVPTHIVHGTKGDYGGHHGIMPVIEHNGRLYTTFEYGAWKFQAFYHCLLSIDAEADLMKAENWTFTEPAPVDRNWPGMPVSARTTAIEGNAVPMPDGEVAVILRIDPLQMPYRSMEQYNKALLVRQDKNDPEAKLQFDRVIDIPVGLRNKFTIYREPNGLGYAAMCNEYTEDYQGRGILTLAVSKDAINWKIAKRIVDVRDDFTHGMQNVGYSYPDFTFDGDDISVISRTAANGAKSQHDNNIISFFRIENYKQYFDIL